jgi:16S rRNA (guanine527-N7)-methyltransferase
MLVAAPEQLQNTSNTHLARQLDAGARALGLVLTEAAVATLLAYLGLLKKWNAAYNLTAVRSLDDMVSRHLLDSLALAPHLSGERFIDVGSGAGLPGVPLAICFPDRHFALLDANGKKTRFLFEVKTRLQISNIAIHQTRVETFTADSPYDGVLSRAFASLPDMAAACSHLLSPTGRFLALKGQYPEEELAALKGLLAAPDVIPLSVPGIDEPRHLVVFSDRAPVKHRGNA